MLHWENVLKAYPNVPIKTDKLPIFTPPKPKLHEMPSVTSIIHPYKDKHGKQKVQLMVCWGRQRIYLKTDVKVIPGQESEKVKQIIRKKVAEAEDRILDAIRDGLTPREFKNSYKKEKAKSILLTEYITIVCEKMKGRMSENTLRHYKSVGTKLPDTYLSEIDKPFLDNFERSLSHLDSNTVFANMKRLKSILYKAEREGYISLSQFEGYKVPAYKQKLVEYLTEKEIASFTKVVKSIRNHSKAISGWYFLLSCFTGWRISDAKRFHPGMIHGNTLVIRAQKNGQIVSMPIIPRLKEVLKFVSKNPFDLAEQTVREFVKEIARDAGISKRVNYHVSRHSYAMLLMKNGFTIDEVASLIGDSPMIAKVYARIHNESLDKKIRERLG